MTSILDADFGITGVGNWIGAWEGIPAGGTAGGAGEAGTVQVGRVVVVFGGERGTRR